MIWLRKRQNKAAKTIMSTFKEILQDNSQSVDTSESVGDKIIANIAVKMSDQAVM